MACFCTAFWSVEAGMVFLYLFTELGHWTEVENDSASTGLYFGNKCAAVAVEPMVNLFAQIRGDVIDGISKSAGR